MQCLESCVACGSTGWHQPLHLGSPEGSYCRDTEQKTALLLLPRGLRLVGVPSVTSGQGPKILAYLVFTPLLQTRACLVIRDTEPTSAINNIQQLDLSLQHSGNAVLCPMKKCFKIYWYRVPVRGLISYLPPQLLKCKPCPQLQCLPPVFFWAVGNPHQSLSAASRYPGAYSNSKPVCK